MVGPWEGQNVLTWHLQGLVYLDSLLLKVARIYHRVNVMEDVRILFEK